MTSWELLRRCAVRNDAGLWEEFVRRFGSRLAWGVCAGLRQVGRTPDRERVDEIVQEVYCHLLDSGRRRLRSFRGTSDGEAGEFLIRLATRVAIDLERRGRTARRGGGATSEVALLDVPTRLVDQRPNVLERLEADEERRDLLARCEAVLAGGCDPRHLEMFRWALIGGLTSREIAARMGGGLVRGAVDVVFHRLRRRLAAAGIVLAGRRPRGGVAAGSPAVAVSLRAPAAGGSRAVAGRCAATAQGAGRRPPRPVVRPSTRGACRAGVCGLTPGPPCT